MMHKPQRRKELQQADFQDDDDDDDKEDHLLQEDHGDWYD